MPRPRSRRSHELSSQLFSTKAEGEWWWSTFGVTTHRPSTGVFSVQKVSSTQWMSPETKSIKARTAIASSTPELTSNRVRIGSSVHRGGGRVNGVPASGKACDT
jgi:hypothetical protein